MKLPEPIEYQYRWTNPAGEWQPESMTAWKPVEPNWNQSVLEKCTELESYRYLTKPTYEVRGLYTEAQLKQAVKDALEAAAVTAWSHYLDTCKANHFAPADNEKWLCANAIRKLMEGI